MKTIETIRQKIEELKAELEKGNYYLDNHEQAIGYESAVLDMECFLDTLEVPVCEELEEAAKNYENSLDYHHYTGDNPSVAFIAGAKWKEAQDDRLVDIIYQQGIEKGKDEMKEQFEKNRLAACDAQTKEEYDREVEFTMNIINKEHRQPTFSDAINYGMKLQKEQMMKEGLDAEITVGSLPDDWSISYNCDELHRALLKFKSGDKVRVIIVKED